MITRAAGILALSLLSSILLSPGHAQAQHHHGGHGVGSRLGGGRLGGGSVNWGAIAGALSNPNLYNGGHRQHNHGAHDNGYYNNPGYYTNPGYQNNTGYYVDPNHYAPHTGGHSVAPQANAIPAPVQPLPNKVLAIPVKPVANSVIGLRTAPITQQQIDAMQQQANQRNQELAKDLAKLRPTDSDIAKLVSGLASQLNSEQQREITRLIQAGRSSDLKKLLADREVPEATATRLLAATLRRGWVDRVTRGLNNGGASVQDIQNLAAALAGRAVTAQTVTLLTSILTNIQFVAILDAARAGNNPIPRGGLVVIVSVSGVPAGTVIPLGNGAVLLGGPPPAGRNRAGRAGGAAGRVPGGAGIPLPQGPGPFIPAPLDINIGDVWQTAGIATAIGPALPEARSGSGRGVVLVNRGETDVNYALDEQQQVSMKPSYSQKLAGDKEWVVIFDRGGSFGTARYTLTEGTYHFVITEKGWDLLAQTFVVTIDNTGNPERFNFVANNTRKFVEGSELGEVRDKFPPVIKFDNGTGKTKEKQLKSGTFKVGTADTQGTVDLFARSSFPPPADPIQPPPMLPDDHPLASLFAGPDISEAIAANSDNGTHAEFTLDHVPDPTLAANL